MYASRLWSGFERAQRKALTTHRAERGTLQYAVPFSLMTSVAVTAVSEVVTWCDGHSELRQRHGQKANWIAGMNGCLDIP